MVKKAGHLVQDQRNNRSQFVRIEINVTAFELWWLNAALSKFRATCKPWAKIRRKIFFVKKFKVSKNRNTLSELKSDLQHQLATERHHQMDSPPHLYQHQQLQLHPKAFDALSEKGKMERWFQDQEWIDSNKHSVSEEDIVHIKTELSQLDEKTYSWLLFSRPMMMMMMMTMMNWWIWKMWKWKKNCIPVQFTTRYV